MPTTEWKAGSDFASERSDRDDDCVTRRRSASAVTSAQRAADHGRRSQRRHGDLRPHDGQDAQPRSPGCTRRAVRSRLLPVSAVQPEPGLAPDRAAARHHARSTSCRPTSARFCPTSSRCRRCSGGTATSRRASARSTTTAIPATSARAGSTIRRRGTSSSIRAGIDKDEEKVAHQPHADARPRQRARLLRVTGTDEEHTDGKVATEGDRAAREEQGPAVLHRRRLLSPALPVHRATQVLRHVSARSHRRAEVVRRRYRQGAAAPPGSPRRRTGT